VLSRVADALYWMMRYVERAENVARFVDVGLYSSLDVADEQSSAPWSAVLKATEGEARYATLHGEVRAEGVIRFLSFDRRNENGIYACLSKARENARAVREVLPREMWEALNRAYHMVHAASQAEGLLESPHAFFSEVKLASHLLHGLHEATMSHDEGWHFARAGGLLERADQGSRILEGHWLAILRDREAQSAETPLVGLLKSMSAHDMYRRRYRRVAARRVLEFLLFDRDFPRSLLASLLGCQASLQFVTRTPRGSAVHPAERLLGRLVARLAYMDKDELPLATLDEFLRAFREDLVAVDIAVRERFFERDAPPESEAPPSRLAPQ